MGYCPWGCKEPDVTEQLSTHILSLLHSSLFSPFLYIFLYMDSIMYLDLHETGRKDGRWINKSLFPHL